MQNEMKAATAILKQLNQLNVDAALIGSIIKLSRDDLLKQQFEIMIRGFEKTQLIEWE